MNYLRASVTALALVLTLGGTLFANPTPATAIPKKGKWETLFDGKTLTGWHNYLKTNQPVSSNWVVDDGAIHFAGGRGGGDLVSDKEYGNFELEIEWKIAEGGNSGIIYHVNEDPKFKATYNTGPEMQVLDNERHPDAKMGRDGNRTAGALYDIQKPITMNTAKPAGEWNKARLVVNNGRAEHYLNGKKVADYPTSGPEWDAMVAQSKFKGWEGFNKFPTGRIALQDHGDKVWYRNIRIREL
ncbi:MULTISPECIES: 3-keto-disaccharide hydrolase [Spirosoma]|uniref:DUF1080 domain-containing protein n=1 Tax=Spirosoma sordidisoli TaxID=2502893 RepID=A0A4V1RWZ5_9BACT|nr:MULTISPECIES: DUF1080 domain-containing protein [Spirosoma]RYC71988.1 DUF1080 domain-containing protein [Spirosoma sordidisoli]